MGVVGNIVVQAIISSIVLGALKRAGVVRVNADAIENQGARQVFVSALEMGEAMAMAGERVIKSIKSS